VDVSAINVRDASEIEGEIADFARTSNGGLILTASALANAHRDLIIALGGSWVKGQSDNPRGRAPVNPFELEWLKRLRVAANRKVKIGEDGKAQPIERKENEKEIDQLTDAAQKVMELAREGNMWAVEHIANRLDGKVKEQVDVTTSHTHKIRYESYEEVRAALLEEGINVDRLPMLTDMRPPEGQERN
jgi:hypothetical protein